MVTRGGGSIHPTLVAGFHAPGLLLLLIYSTQSQKEDSSCTSMLINYCNDFGWRCFESKTVRRRKKTWQAATMAYTNESVHRENCLTFWKACYMLNGEKKRLKIKICSAINPFCLHTGERERSICVFISFLLSIGSFKFNAFLWPNLFEMPAFGSPLLLVMKY